MNGSYLSVLLRVSFPLAIASDPAGAMAIDPFDRAIVGMSINRQALIECLGTGRELVMDSRLRAVTKDVEKCLIMEYCLMVLDRCSVEVTCNRLGRGPKKGCENREAGDEEENHFLESRRAYMQIKGG